MSLVSGKIRVVWMNLNQGMQLFLENEFSMKENIENKSSLKESNQFELSSTSDVLIPSLMSGRDIRMDGNLKVPMVHDHEDHHMEDANDYQNGSGDQEEVLMKKE